MAIIENRKADTERDSSKIAAVMKALVRKYGMKIFAICFWLLLWEIVSLRLGQEILLASPIASAGALLNLSGSPEFWRAILFSSLRIIVGFLTALAVGTILAVASYNVRFIKELITPLMKIIQAMPVASFIILALVWIRSRNLSVLASFLMVMPLIYTNLLQGLEGADQKLLQMARVFRINRTKRFIAIYIPAVIPHLLAAVSVGVGLCWKAGIAAEVIGTPVGSIGAQLYEAKLYLMTKELFAWTAVIIVISILFEKAVMLLVRLPHNYTIIKEEKPEE